MFKKPTVHICVPIHRAWCTESEEYLNRAIDARQGWEIGGILKLYEESLIQRGRNYLLKEFLKTKSDYLLWIDDDIVLVDPESINKLVKASKDIIGGMCVCKKPPYRPNFLPLGKTYPDYRNKEKPEEIYYLSTSCMLVKREVCEKVALAHKYPFDCFEAMVEGHGLVYLSEDWAFCERAKFFGYKIFIHPSVDCGHIGKYAYSMLDYYAYNNIGEPIKIGREEKNA